MLSLDALIIREILGLGFRIHSCRKESFILTKKGKFKVGKSREELNHSKTIIRYNER